MHFLYTEVVQNYFMTSTKKHQTKKTYKKINKSNFKLNSPPKKIYYRINFSQKHKKHFTIKLLQKVKQKIANKLQIF